MDCVPRIVDIPARLVEVAIHPGHDGYSNARRVAAGGTIVPAPFPDLMIEVADILG